MRDLCKYLEVQNVNLYASELEKVNISMVSTDTRTIEPGSMFIAIKGDKYDGNDYIDSAYEKGAIAVISNKCIYPMGITKINTGYIIRVDDSIKAYQAIARYYRLQHKIELVGVTGSVGKTTTKEIISEVLSQSGHTLKTIGNLNNEIGVPSMLLKLNEFHKYAVIEMGMSNLNEISPLSKASDPKIAVITNIGRSHLENLGNLDNVLKAKLEILEGMNSQGIVILNGDDNLLWGIEKRLDISQSILYYGIENRSCDILASNIRVEGLKTKYDLEYADIKLPVTIHEIGRHNVLNSLAAVAVGISLNIDIVKVITGIQQKITKNMRQEIEQVNNIKIIKDCYNANPESFKAAIESLELIEVDGKRVVVLGDMLELGKNERVEHENLGDLLLNSQVSHLICYGKLSKYTADRVRQLNVDYPVYHSYNSWDIVLKLSEIVKSGDAVLFKASRGLKLENIIEMMYKECLNQ